MKKNRVTKPRAQRTERLLSAVESEIVEFLIDDTFLRSKRLGRMGKRVVQAQARLRSLVDDAAWGAYLTLEDATNTRAAEQVRLVVRRMLDVVEYALLDGLPDASFTSKRT